MKCWHARCSVLYVDFVGDSDHFTIKCHLGGQFESNPKSYVDGQIRYVDMCDVDKMSIIEVFSMFNECGETGSFLELYYKQSSSDMDVPLFPLKSDADVGEMCNHLDSSRLMYVYCETNSNSQ